MKTLLIDNYDSFTYNLFQLIAEVNGQEPIVVRNDEASWEELAELPVDNVVVSPGPGRPERVEDFGVSADAIRWSQLPLLGVCLGHQGIGLLAGGTVVHAPEPMHGRIATVVHRGASLFAGIPREFEAVRYHSLCLARPLPEALEPLAWTRDGVLMGLAHRRRPQWGVQFHPESIATEHGRRVLANFRDLSVARLRTARPVRARPVVARRARCALASGSDAGLELRVRRLDGLIDAERAFTHLYGGSETAFWLDSSMVHGRARFSFMGDARGPLSRVVTYRVAERTVRVDRHGNRTSVRCSLFDWLAQELRRLKLESPELPFDFNGGFVGYLGYELKADTVGELAHVSSTPDAALMFADRMVVIDHLQRTTYLVAVVESARPQEGERWLREVAGHLASLPPVTEPDWASAVLDSKRPSVRFTWARSPEQYLDDIARCKQFLADGESYEICLTNRIATDVRPEPLALYRSLRQMNPAPFAAYLRFGELAVLSSSPERFLAIGRDRWVEARPIKGTAPRGATSADDARLADQLRTDEKSRAENLMIADLLRNDLGIVCDVGTVHVPSLMQVESFETVHQLVTTVRGRLREDISAPECTRACFPGGSMTGAPKKRTMEIIDELEQEARGVYSGAIGYFGLAGTCDLSIVIRTIVIDGAGASIGVGGAIVAQSDPRAELAETMLKGRAPMRAIEPRSAVPPGTAA